jgi:hypothetical protein
VTAAEQPVQRLSYDGEYDVLTGAARRVNARQHGGKPPDVITRDDGREIWFDVTAIRPPRLASLPLVAAK